ncbi:hypothetical protein GpartN1_g6212.t1 [Galdieria partita]|uniref:NAD(P)-binding domain-containing protein n=1 Tax=Galdieria partita TaxID=83374 RepID=A0A9C7Q1D8_9RHOD|nr:hypothetical protein GpartN1_g6212.t1 [Galdieria partita]
MSCFGRDFEKLVYRPHVILVTGGAGFIGSHVVSYLLREYPEYVIINYDKLDYCASLKNLNDIADFPNYRFVKGDILSEDLLSYVLESHSVDTVIHMAAQTHVDASFGNSLFFTKTNVLGTHTLLECCRRYGRVGRFIHQSTDEIYGGEYEGMNTELTLPAPSNPYACSKAAAEFIAVGYYKSFGLPVMITRSNNVYGPRQYPDKLIPKSICLLKQGKKCFVHGDGKHRRNWLYAEDAARAIDCILHRGVVGEIYNVGSDFECCTLDVIRDLISLCGYDDGLENHIQYVRDRPYNDRRYRLDSTKLRSLGWLPLVTWKRGLQRTLEWYSSDNIHNWDEGFGFQSGLVSHPNHLTLEKQNL